MIHAKWTARNMRTAKAMRGMSGWDRMGPSISLKTVLANPMDFDETCTDRALLMRPAHNLVGLGTPPARPGSYTP